MLFTSWEGFRKRAKPSSRRRYDLSDDAMARLYLGVTLVRQGHRERGLQETTAGLKAIYQWLDYIEANLPQGIYWDSNREVRSEIERVLKQMTDRRLSAEQLIETAEWVGNRHGMGDRRCATGRANEPKQGVMRIELQAAR